MILICYVFLRILGTQKNDVQNAHIVTFMRILSPQTDYVIHITKFKTGVNKRVSFEKFSQSD